MALTWPAYKACEPHAALLTLIGLAALAVASPTAWEVAWRAYVAVMAALAPILASARIARAIVRGTVEDEFARWFRLLERSAGAPPQGASHAGRPRS